MRVFFLRPVLLLLLATLAHAQSGNCTSDIAISLIVQSFEEVMPTNDGSSLVASDALSALLNNIRNNLNAVGVDMSCDSARCTVNVPDSKTRAKLYMLAILGNFVNHDLDNEDAIAHLNIDTSTGLLQRAHTLSWTRLVVSDVLLVLAVIMLAHRALTQPRADEGA